MEHHNRRARDRLSKYLRNKRVVLVGPAPSIIGSNQGKLIDDYDVVVRLNKAVPVPSKLKNDIGTRTDILYNCMNPSDECGGPISISVLKKKNVRFLVGAFPPIEKIGSQRMRLKKDVMDFFSKNRLRYNNFCYTDKGHFNKLWREVKLPNTGIMAITDLLRFPIKELYITGITFFKGGYYSQYRKYDEKGVLEHMKKFGLHKPDRQLKYMARELSNDKRVKMDTTLEQIIAEELQKQEDAKNDLEKDTNSENLESDQESNDKTKNDHQELDELKQVNEKENNNKEVENQTDKQKINKDKMQKKNSEKNNLELSDQALEICSSNSVNLYIKS